MRSITDPTFRYTPSYMTDIRQTFARVRRERRTAERSFGAALPLLPAQRAVRARLDAEARAPDRRAHMTTIRWRSHTERPQTDEPITALVAISDESGDARYLYGFVAWRRGRWECEITSEPLVPPFWWLPEGELLARVPAARAAEGDRHDHTR